LGAEEEQSRNNYVLDFACVRSAELQLNVKANHFKAHVLNYPRVARGEIGAPIRLKGQPRRDNHPWRVLWHSDRDR
jgi:hypothetical protein